MTFARLEHHRLAADLRRHRRLAARLGARAQLGKQVALGTSIVTFVLSLPLWVQFDFDSAGMQFVENVPWIARFNANYALGVDGISMPLVLLTTFLTPFVVVAGLGSHRDAGPRSTSRRS